MDDVVESRPAAAASWATNDGVAIERCAPRRCPGGGAGAFAPSESSTNAARRVSWFAAGPQPAAPAVVARGADEEVMARRRPAPASAACCMPLARVSALATPLTVPPNAPHSARDWPRPAQGSRTKPSASSGAMPSAAAGEESGVEIGAGAVRRRRRPRANCSSPRLAARRRAGQPAVRPRRTRARVARLVELAPRLVRAPSAAAGRRAGTARPRPEHREHGEHHGELEQREPPGSARGDEGIVAPAPRGGDDRAVHTGDTAFDRRGRAVPRGAA